MPLCGWCGRQTNQAREYQNGSSLIRLCADCAAQQSNMALRLHQTPPPSDDAIPGTPGWIKLTAWVVLIFGFLVPTLYFLGVF